MRYLLATSCLLSLTAACSGSVSGTNPTGGTGTDTNGTAATGTGTTTATDGTIGATEPGATTVVNPDGTTTIVSPDGTTTTVAADGTTTTATPDGTTGTEVTDGTTTATTGTPTELKPLQDPNVTPTDPGRVTMHRLNNAEYNNTVRDLLGTSLRPADGFVTDDRGAGFDNIADVLSLSATHLDMYATAAATLVETAMADATQRAGIVSCDLAAQGAACAREALTGFLPRAFRRPVTDTEIDRFMAPVDLAIGQGETAETGLSLSLRAALLSPNFLFRAEFDAAPTDLTAHALAPHELASRLSYFLWSSMPDAELFAAADAGTLNDPAVIQAQITRMLASPKAAALVDNFAGQWLRLRAIADVTPDSQTFPEFDDGLRAAMRTESELLFSEVISSGAPMSTLLLADFTYVNDQLAQHYGLPAPGSSDFVRTSLLDNTERRGFLAHGGILTVTSHPRRTSPVNRGKWVMDDLMCQTIPPPPADVDTSAFAQAVEEGASLRERLEAHRADPTCAACHSLMDPIGFGLENFNPIGAYRATEESGAAVDSTGQLPDGRAFSGAIELVGLLSSDPNFSRCVSQKLFTYALGRPPILTDSTYFDPSTIDSLTTQVATGAGFESLVAGLATSMPFTNRRGDADQGGAL